VCVCISRRTKTRPCLRAKAFANQITGSAHKGKKSTGKVKYFFKGPGVKLEHRNASPVTSSPSRSSQSIMSGSSMAVAAAAASFLLSCCFSLSCAGHSCRLTCWHSVWGTVVGVAVGAAAPLPVLLCTQ